MAVAKTNKIAEQLKELPALQRATARRAMPPKSNALYLLELRFRHAEGQSALPKRKLTIAVEAREGADASPREIKIRHL
jgi:hypothetical protein